MDRLQEKLLIYGAMFPEPEVETRENQIILKSKDRTLTLTRYNDMYLLEMVFISVKTNKVVYDYSYRYVRRILSLQKGNELIKEIGKYLAKKQEKVI